jgi:hypothetical protein
MFHVVVTAFYPSFGRFRSTFPAKWRGDVESDFRDRSFRLCMTVPDR